LPDWAMSIVANVKLWRASGDKSMTSVLVVLAGCAAVEPRQGNHRPSMEVCQLHAGTRKSLADVKSRRVNRGMRSKSPRLPPEPFCEEMPCK
jgi:hypothetical protein